ncbi:hypothetical protein GCM10027346_36510 [Hymenobacter seoulensis]
MVLTDFSATADNALRYAAVVAARLAARIVVLHVRRDSLLEPEAFTGKLVERSDAQLQALLGERYARVEAQGVACTGTVARGDVADALVATARAQAAGLAVAGQRDTEYVPDEMVDSTSLSLLRHAPCPLLIVPHSFAGQQLPATVLLATDGQPAALDATARPINALLRTWQPTMQPVEVVEQEAATGREEAFLAAGSALLEGLATAPTLFPVAADPVAGLLASVPADQNAWLLLVARHHSRLGSLFHHSVTAAMVLHLKVPLLIVAEP